MDPPNDLNNAGPSTRLPSTLRDPTTLTFQKDGLRRSIILAYWIVILFSLPIWWHTTSIQRLSLPSNHIQQVARNHLTLPIVVCLDIVDSSFIQDVGTQLAQRQSHNQERWKGLAVTVTDQKQCNETAVSDSYTIVPTAGPPTIRDRTLSFPLTGSNASANLVNLLEDLLAPYSQASDPERRAAQYSTNYRLAFSLLNEDSAAGNAVLDWDIRTELIAYIQPILHRLTPLHNFTVESQIQYHAPLAFTPRHVDEAYGLTPEQLTVFINSAEWTLSSSSSNDPVLHFVLFIPSNERRPLGILNQDGMISQSNAFLLPQWGGFVIYNPSTDILSDDQLPRHKMDVIFSQFSSQLLSLLGVSPLPIGVFASTIHDSLLSEWRLDALARRRTLENAQGSQDTLLSIVKLVDQIENMPVGDDVKDDVEQALTALASMYDSSTSLSLQQKFAYSARSFGLASRAFFNPGMLALLYFPAEHKYAIYSPLFASAVIPLFVAALREILALRREHASRRGKTLSN